MSEGLEGRMRHQAATLDCTEMVEVYPGDVVELIDEYKASVVAAGHECEALRRLSRLQLDEIEELRGMSDAVERLREIGRAIGCDHIDDFDGRHALVNCVEQVVANLEATNQRLCTQLHASIMGDNIDTKECDALLADYAKAKGY